MLRLACLPRKKREGKFGEFGGSLSGCVLDSVRAWGVGREDDADEEGLGSAENSVARYCGLLDFGSC